MANLWHTAEVLDRILDYVLRNTAWPATRSFGGSGGQLVLKDGAVPVSAEAATANSGICSVAAMPSNYWSAAAGGIAEWNTPRNTSNAGSNTTITHAVLTTGSITPTCLGLFTVGVAGSGAGVILNSLTAVSGNPLTVEDFGLKIPLALGTMKINTALANRILDGIIGNGGVTTPTLASKACRVYAGAAPATADDAVTGSLLAEYTVSNATWAAGAGGAASLPTPLSDASANNSGTGGYARMVFGTADELAAQMSIGLSGSGAAMILDSLSFTSGVAAPNINAATFSIAQP